MALLKGFSFSLSAVLAALAMRRRDSCPHHIQRLHSIPAEETCPICHQWRAKQFVQGVQVSIVCADCTIKHFGLENIEGDWTYTISEFEVVDALGCLPRDLEHLPHDCSLEKSEDAVIERRYLRSDVWYLRNMRRKEALEQAMGIRLRDVHPLIRHFMLGDYLSQFSNSKTTLKDVAKYKPAIRRATEIVERCRHAHPKGALDFCLLYPKAGPKEFQEMKLKMVKVFELEGRRILHGLAGAEMVALKDGPLGDVLGNFCCQDSNAIIRGYLSASYDASTIDVIMSDDGWRRHHWASGPEDRIASHLIDFWKKKLLRKTRLMRALNAKGLSMPKACFDCEGYLNGLNVLSLKEIVAVVDLRDRLKKFGFRERDMEWCIGFDRLFRCLKKERETGHTKLIIRALNAALQSRKSRY